MPWFRPHTSVGGAWSEHNHHAGPCGPAKILDFRYQNIRILEKIARCARQDHTKTDECHDSAIGNTKSEDPAKMTYSIPDFVSPTCPQIVSQMP